MLDLSREGARSGGGVSAHQLRLNPAVRLLLVVPSGVSPTEAEMLTPSNNFCSAPTFRSHLPLASFSDNSSDIVVAGWRVTVMSAPSRASQNGDSGCFTVTAAEPFGLSLDDHAISLPACGGSRSFDAGAVASVEASTLSWLQSSSKSLMSASSASGAAAASVADASGSSTKGTVCAPAR